jgi:hypothetical protein
LPVIVSVLLIAGIFFLDLYASEGVAVGILYIAPIALIAMWSPPSHPSLVIVATVVCTVLTVIDLFYWSSGAMPKVVLSNHALAVGAMWATAILSLIRKRAEQKHRWVDLLPRL